MRAEWSQREEDHPLSVSHDRRLFPKVNQRKKKKRKPPGNIMASLRSRRMERQGGHNIIAIVLLLIRPVTAYIVFVTRPPVNCDL